MSFNQEPEPVKTEVAGPRWYVILSTLAALATIISVGFLVVPYLPIGKTTPKPTATPQPSPTPHVLTYSAQNPGPGCGANQDAVWTPVNAQVECRESGLAITAKIDPAAAVRLNAELQFLWKNHPFPQDYIAKANVSPQATSDGETVCGGIDALGSTAGSYILVVCSDGEWLVARYNNKGAASVIATGLLSKKSVYEVQVHVTSQDIISTVDGAEINRTTRDPSYAQTSYLELVTTQPGKIPATDRTVTSLFTDFSYSYQSAS